ncbi:protein of unknown function [Methanocaldococcus lauensis]|uniref:Uncharacterized protein n=1 Tax=Methanocaldococcus lauensis TaxID=2546128 RepID=A0A8D6PU29_9EURY|nr:protein of unknown function [Methanocaldococcus lauensis]
MFEAYQRGLWKTKRENINELKKIYLAIEGNIEESYNDDYGEYQGGIITIDTSWKHHIFYIQK